MIKPMLCEGCSVLIALVLVVADCRHIARDAPEATTAFSNPTAADSRHILEIDLQSRMAEVGTVGPTGSDVVRQLSGLSALYSAGAGRVTYAGLGPRT